jgi:hypothetical protein
MSGASRGWLKLMIILKMEMKGALDFKGAVLIRVVKAVAIYTWQVKRNIEASICHIFREYMIFEMSVVRTERREQRNEAMQPDVNETKQEDLRKTRMTRTSEFESGYIYKAGFRSSKYPFLSPHKTFPRSD